jgi:hypothetical protein
MEPEGSIPCQQQPVTELYLHPDESNPRPKLDAPMIHSNTINPPTPMSSEWSPPFRPSNQNFVGIDHLPNARHIPRPHHPPWSSPQPKYIFIIILLSTLALPSQPPTSSFLIWSPTFKQHNLRNS